MAKKQAATGGLSLRTKDASQGGGTEGATAVIKSIGWVDEFTYGGRQKDKPQAALEVVYEIEGFDKPWDQNYTAGPSEKYEVIADGAGIKSVGKQTGLNKKSGAYRWFEALEAAAEESNVDLDDILPELDGGGHSVLELEGRTVVLTNVEYETVGGDKKQMIVIAKFVDDEAPAKGKSNGKSAGKADDIEAELEAIVVTLLEETPAIKKGDLSTMVLNHDRKAPNARALMQLAMKDSFIAGEDRPWTFDAKKGVLRANTD